MPEKRRKTEYLSTAFLLLVILGYLAVFTVIDFKGFARLATSDMYEDTLVARLMWEKKSLFPDNYLFGNQFYVIATPVLSALFYGVTSSMNRAMALATGCMSVFLLVSMGWMLRPVLPRPALRAAAVLVFLASLFGPYTVFREDGQQLFFAMCSFYACYLLCFFVVLGDYLRARREEARRRPALLLSLFLCFCTGMQSLRQTCILILPLLSLEGLHALVCLLKKQAPWPKGARMRLWRVLGYTAANLAGTGLIRLLPVRRHEIYGGASIFSGASLSEKLRETLTALVTVTGYDYTREGDGRLFYILMFLTTVGLILAAFCLLVKKKRSPQGAAVFWLLSLIGCLAVVAASFVTSVRLRPIYLFLWYTLPAFSYAVIAERAKPRLLAGLTAALCVLAAANLYFSYRDDLRITLSTDPWPAQEAADWAVDNGYELVYGNQSMSAPAVAVCADGALTAGCWQDDFPYKVSPHINIRDIYRLADAGRAVFVFLATEEEAMVAEAAANGVTMTFRGAYGYYRLYTASGQCLWPITETIDYVPEYN